MASSTVAGVAASTRPRSMPLLFALTTLASWNGAEAFAPPRTTPACPALSAAAAATATRARRRTALFQSEAALPLSTEDDDEEMEWVEEEFELLTERDFYNTEWKIGTLMDDKPRDPNSIDTTWVRLVTTEGGENKAIWGDDSKGKWTIDVPSQFFSISKETFGGWFGKKIWAGTIDDFYFLEGTVRGWSPISPASVVGQWQAVRLGVVDGERVGKEERGEAPWFAEEEEDEVDGDDDVAEEEKNSDVVA